MGIANRKKRRRLWLRAGILLTALFFPDSSTLFAEDIRFIYPASPTPWIVVVLVSTLFFVSLAVLLFIIRHVLGDKSVQLPAQVRQRVQETYLERVRGEFKLKNDLLNKRLVELRQKFSLVMMKVKNLSTTLDSKKLFQALIDLLEQDIGAAKFIIFWYDKEREELYPFRWVGYDGSERKELALPLSLPHFLTFAYTRKQMVYKFAAVDDPLTKGLLDREPLPGTLLALPITTAEECFGVIHIESMQGGTTEIDDADLRFFSSLCSFMGMAVSNANVFLQTRTELTSSKQLSEKELKEKKHLKEIFSRYTSAELVDSILDNPGSINLGGTTKEATILFSDIAGFTKFSSKLSPAQVVSTMNEYLSCMTEVVLNHNGEIDKFIGDAVMARFGVLGNLESSGLAAVQAALAMLDELKKLQAKWAQENRECFSIRIGVASGPVLAGNIGSERRMEFTVMGTAVNLASRLEHLNKELGTTLLIDEETYNQSSQLVRARPRDHISIRGLEGQGQISVYEVLGYHDGVKGSPKVVSLIDRLPSNAAKPPEPKKKIILPPLPPLKPRPKDENFKLPPVSPPPASQKRG